MSEKKKTCFVISPIGKDESDTRKRADQILKHVIQPAVGACGFVPIRADQISDPGMITHQVIQHLVDDPLVIADLTDKNPNVFYELAIRHAIRKPVVQLIQKGQELPFNLKDMRTILVDYPDPDSMDKAKQEIQKQICAVIDKRPEEIKSLISISIEPRALRLSEDPEEETFLLARCYVQDKLKVRPGNRASFEAIREEVDVGFSDDFLEKLIDKYPAKFRTLRVKRKGQKMPGITLVEGENGRQKEN
jgi:hypothetical protein